MATRTAQTTDQGLGVGPNEASALRGLKMETIHYSDIDDAETVTPGSNSIVDAYFKPDAAADDINVVVTNATTLTFNAGTGSAHSGTVLVFSRGY